MYKKQTIALTGGWSGGHIFPLLALQNYLKEEGKYNFVWVWEEDSLEEETARKHKIRFFGVSAGKLRRYFDWKNFYEPLKNLTGIFEGIYYILKYKIDLVFSKGGYVSLPICIAAWILRKNIYIHESDIKTGISNKIVSKLATKVFYTFENEKIDAVKHIHTGPVLNPDLIEYLDSLENDANLRLNVLVIAGSQWSKTIFENLLRALPNLSDVDFHIVLGTKNESFRERFKAFPNTKVHDFLTQKRMGKIMKNIDIAITRGSSTVLWELYYFGIHSIIIPITNAGDHQVYNAEYFMNKCGSNVLDENNNLGMELEKLLQKYKHLRKQGLNLEGFFKPLQIIEKEIQ